MFSTFGAIIPPVYTAAREGNITFIRTVRDSAGFDPATAFVIAAQHEPVARYLYARFRPQLLPDHLYSIVRDGAPSVVRRYLSHFKTADRHTVLLNAIKSGSTAMLEIFTNLYKPSSLELDLIMTGITGVVRCNPAMIDHLRVLGVNWWYSLEAALQLQRPRSDNVLARIRSR